MGQAIVKTDIPVGGVLAYTRGQTIDTDAVEANGWADHVVGENTKEAAEIKAEITGRPVEDFYTKPTSRSAAGTKQEG